MSSYSQSDIYHSIFSDIYTVFCGMQDCPPSYSFGPAVRNCYLLHLCLEGEGVFTPVKNAIRSNRDRDFSFIPVS